LESFAGKGGGGGGPISGRETTARGGGAMLKADGKLESTREKNCLKWTMRSHGT